MAPDTIIATIHSRGGRLRLLNGDRLAVIPRSTLDDQLREAIRREKPALVARLRQESEILADSNSACTVQYQRIYDTLSATFGTTEDLRAFVAVYDAGARDLPDRLAALEGTCEQLAQDGAPEGEYREAVEALVNFARQVRQAHQAAQQAEPVPATAPNGPLVVAIADPCLTCSGVEYHLPPVDNLVHCVHCSDPEPSPAPRRGARR